MIILCIDFIPLFHVVNNIMYNVMCKFVLQTYLCIKPRNKILHDRLACTYEIKNVQFNRENQLQFT